MSPIFQESAAPFVGRAPAAWHPPCSIHWHEPPKCLLLMGFAVEGVPILHTRVPPRHHTAAESLAIIEDSSSSDTILGAASGIAYAGDTLFVADSNRVGASPTNHRVLLYQNLSGMLPRPTDSLIYSSKCPVCVGQATLVLGQPDFTTATLNLSATSTSLRLV